MWEDPIVREIHENRQGLLDRFQGDIGALFEHFKSLQEKSDRKIIKPKKRRPVESTNQGGPV